MSHYDDVTMSLRSSQITSLTIIYSTVYSGADQRKHQSPASLTFVRGIQRGPVNSPHKWPVTRQMFPFDYVIMLLFQMTCPVALLYREQTAATSRRLVKNCSHHNFSFLSDHLSCDVFPPIHVEYQYCINKLTTPMLIYLDL